MDKQHLEDSQIQLNNSVKSKVKSQVLGYEKHLMVETRDDERAEKEMEIAENSPEESHYFKKAGGEI